MVSLRTSTGRLAVRFHHAPGLGDDSAPALIMSVQGIIPMTVRNIGDTMYLVSFHANVIPLLSAASSISRTG